MTSGNPSSSSYPGLMVFQRKAAGKSLTLCHGKSHSYPDGDTTFLYYEFRGWGTPPADVGLPGDIYLDVTSPYIIYFVGEGGWEPWNPQASDCSQVLAQHPNYHDKYLWTNAKGLSWIAKRTLRGVKTDQKYTMDQEMDRELSDMLSDIMSGAFVMGLEDVDNRRRCGLEMERRRRCGVPVDDDQRSPHLRKIQGLKSKERGWRIKITATAPRTPQEAIRNENLIAEAQRVKTPNEGLKQQLHISEERCNPLVHERDSSDKRYNTLISEHEIQIDRIDRDLKRKYALEAESGDMYDALRERLAQALLRIEDLEHQVSRGEFNIGAASICLPLLFRSGASKAARRWCVFFFNLVYLINNPYTAEDIGGCNVKFTMRLKKKFRQRWRCNNDLIPRQKPLLNWRKRRCIHELHFKPVS
ncbi:hypothetical protein C8R43DRAFT_1032342 [Mycena crocata]|nr:hypothetical protein C8R43DRAFT_1032342 [Mycena crocata]